MASATSSLAAESLTLTTHSLVGSFLSLGSNVGDRANMLLRAGIALAETKDINIKRKSCIIDNPALLVSEQANFLNQVIEIETKLTPEALLTCLQNIEKQLGRIHRFRYGPREIDLDILSYGKLSYDSPRLQLPHPALRERPYLQTLLADLGTSPKTILAECRS